MSLPVVEAMQFLERAKSGRNHPPILACQAGDELVEFYVKFRNGTETPKSSLIFEMLGVDVARALGLLTADPAIVHIGAEFCEGVEDSEMRTLLRANIGPNFGSKALAGGYGIFQVTDSLPPSDFRRAAEIFAFDAFVQNPDRKSRNPNLLIKGDEWRVIDHEVAFSFARPLIGLQTSDEGPLMNLLQEHMFYRPLKGHDVDLDLFEKRFGQMLDSGILYEWISELPHAWTAGEDEVLDRISKHFERMSKGRNDFLKLVKRVLQ